MTKRSTKKSLVLSCLALLLCFSMLIGTTFAWFTDSVTSSGNIIQSGTLDIELMWADGKTDPKNTEWKDASEGAIFNSTLWEPGYTDAKHMDIINNGTLALKYQLRIEPTGEVSDLADVIDVYFIEGATQLARTGLENRTPVGTLADVINGGIAYGNLAANENRTFTIVLKMQESAGNEYQNKSIGSAFAIKLIATQFTAEEDSFGPDYDGGAMWLGDIDVSWYDPAATEVTISNPEQLAGLAAIVNGTAVAPATTFAADSETTIHDDFAGKTVTLVSDIDLNNIAWTPIGRIGAKSTDFTYAFKGTFDGQNHTVSNLKVSNEGWAGLFGVAYKAEIKNVTVDGAEINSCRMVGAIVGQLYGNIDNCHVKDADITVVPNWTGSAYDNGDKVGGIVGWIGDNNNNRTLTNCSVDGLTATAYRDLGGIAGYVAWSTTLQNNKVTNSTLVGDQSVNSYGKKDYNVNEIWGRNSVSSSNVGVTDVNNSFENVSVVKTVSAFTAADFAAALNGYDNKITEKNISIVLSSDLEVAITSLGTQTDGSGEYKLGGADTETITIDLNGHKLTITTTYWSAIGAQNPDAVFTIKNGTMTSSQATGTWNSYDVTFANCNYVIEDVTFEKAVAFTNEGKSVVMNDVTINETHDYYALWITAEGQSVAIDGLTVNSAGRGIKIDAEYVSAPTKVTLSVSNATFDTAKKSAIMVKSAAGADITLDNVDISAADADYVNAVWVDADATAYADLVTVNGGSKVNEDDIATNSDELGDAIKEGKTEILLAGGTFQMPASAKGKTLTLTGLGATVIEVVPGGQGEANGQLDYSLDGSTVTFNNLTIKTNSQLYAGYARLSATYNNCTIQNTYNLGTGNSEFNNCVFNITNEYLRVGGAYSATFNGCTFNTDGRAILIFQDGTSVAQTVTVKDCTFNATAAANTWNGIHVSAVSIDGTNGTYTVKLEGTNTVDSDFNGLWQIKAGEANVTVNE